MLFSAIIAKLSINENQELPISLSRKQEVTMNKATLDRVAYLLESKTPQKDMDLLITLQKEQAPWLSTEEATDCVVFSLVRYYEDYQLSFLWWSDAIESHYSQKAA